MESQREIVEELWQLEAQELEGLLAQNAGGFVRLLALYLVVNDLRQAQLLWKRLPAQKKEADSELVAVWHVAQKLWIRDFSTAYAAAKTREWSENLK